VEGRIQEFDKTAPPLHEYHGHEEHAKGKGLDRLSGCERPYDGGILTSNP